MPNRREFTRRRFLLGVGAGGALLFVPWFPKRRLIGGAPNASERPFEQFLEIDPIAEIPASWASGRLRDVAGCLRIPLAGCPASWRVLRARDFLLFDVDLSNLEPYARPSRPGAASVCVVPGGGSAGAAGAIRRTFLRAKDPKLEALVRITLPPQHVAEAAYAAEDPVDAKLFAFPVPAALSGRSRVVLQVPNSLKDPGAGFPFDLATILDWDRFPLRVLPIARPAYDQPGENSGVPHFLPPELRAPASATALLGLIPPVRTHRWRPDPPPPGWRSGTDIFECASRPGSDGADERPSRWYTGIELPSLLYLSPHAHFHWRSDRLPLAEGPGTELWHASAMSPHRYDERMIAHSVPGLDTIRVVWSRGFDPAVPDKGLPPSCADDPKDTAGIILLPSPDHASDLVRLTSDFTVGRMVEVPKPQADGAPTEFKKKQVEPTPADLSSLHLSSLGGSVRAHGAWNPSRLLRSGDAPGDYSTEIRDLLVDEWTQDTVWGRDAYVLVSVKGYLMPFGHEASLVQVRQREFQNGTRRGGKFPVAVLRERWFVKVRERTKVYDDVSVRKDEKESLPWLRGRRMPFEIVSIEDDRTPYLRSPRVVGPMWMVAGPQDSFDTPGPLEAAILKNPEELKNLYEALCPGATIPSDVGLALNDYQRTHLPFAIRLLPESAGVEKPFAFKLRGVDRQGKSVDFTMPLIFLLRNIAEQALPSTALEPGYQKVLGHVLRTYSSLVGERTTQIPGTHMSLTAAHDGGKSAQNDQMATHGLTFACETAGDDAFGPYPEDPEDTWLPERLRRSAVVGSAGGALRFMSARDKEPAKSPFPDSWRNLRFYPALACAEVELDAVKKFAPESSDANTCLHYDRNYVEHGLPTAKQVAEAAADPKAKPHKNPGEVVARVLTTSDHSPSLDFEPERGGGIANPSMQIAGISRIAGPISGAENGNLSAFAGGTFNPADAFKALANGLEAKLFGIVSLKDVLRVVSGAGSNLESIPRLIKEETEPVLRAIETVQNLVGEARSLIAAIQSVSRFVEDGSFSRALLPDTLRQIDDAVSTIRGELQVDLTVASIPDLETVAASAEALRHGLDRFATGISDEGAKIAAAWTAWPREFIAALDGATATERIRLEEFRKQVDELIALPRPWESVLALLEAINPAAKLRSIRADATTLVESADRFVRSLPERLVEGLRAPVVAAINALKSAASPLDILQAVRAATDALAQVTGGEDSSFVLSAGDSVLRGVEELKRSLQSSLLDRIDALFEIGSVDKFSALANFATTLGDMVSKGRASLESAESAFVDTLTPDLQRRLSSAFDEGTCASRRALDAFSTASEDVTAAVKRLTVPLGEFVRQVRLQTDAVTLSVDAARKHIRGRVHTWLQDPAAAVGDFGEALRRRVAAISGALDTIAKRTDSGIQGALAGALDVAAAARAPLKDLRSRLEGLNGRIKDLLDHLPKDLSLRYSWDLPLKDWPNPDSGALFMAKRIELGGASRPSKFKIETSIKQNVLEAVAGKVRPQAKIDAQITDFTLRLIPSAEFLLVNFERISFGTGGDGDKNVDVKVGEVKFGRELDFIGKLGSALSSGTGFRFDVSSRGILVAYQWGLPAITTGALNLYNLAFSTGVRIPFRRGDPLLLHLGVSSRERPFMLTVGILGGGGHFALELAPDGLRHFEMSMEYGATVAIDLGVANGMLYARGGIFYSSTVEPERGLRIVVFEAYFRAGGALSVIGLINAFLEFHVGLVYVSRNGQGYAEGVARLTVRIELLFFSISVTVEMRKQIAGSKASDDGARGPLGATGIVGRIGTGRETQGSPSRRSFAEDRWTVVERPLDGRDWVAETNRWSRHLVLVGLRDSKHRGG